MLDVITRPATADDAPVLHALIAAGEVRHGGRIVTAPDAVAANLARTTLDLAHDTLVVHIGARLSGWAWMHIGKRAHVYVHPDFEGRGLGTWLLEWAEAQARAAGSPDLGQTIDDANTAAGELLHRHGYRPKATQWQLEIALPSAPGGGLAPGISVRTFQKGDAQAVYRMTEDAFMDWQERRRSYDEWSKLTVGRDHFAPAQSPLAFDGERLVAAVLSLNRPGSQGHIERVAVDRAYRRRGIAQSLLRAVFDAFSRAGKSTCALFTHSETGALSLYEKAGMTVTHSATHVRKPLG